MQIVIALVVTPEGFPLAYEVMAGNTSDKTTLRDFLKKIEDLHGKAERIWVMDRGVPTEAVLAEMRASDPPVSYLVGTPKGRLKKDESKLVEQPWKEVREGVEVKLLAESGEMYVLAQSRDRVRKERAMRRRQLKGLWKRLKELRGKELKRDDLLLKLGAAKNLYPSAWRIGLCCPQAGDDPDGFDFLTAVSELANAVNPSHLRDVRKAHLGWGYLAHLDATPFDAAVAFIHRLILRGKRLPAGSGTLAFGGRPGCLGQPARNHPHLPAQSLGPFRLGCARRP